MMVGKNMGSEKAAFVTFAINKFTPSVILRPNRDHMSAQTTLELIGDVVITTESNGYFSFKRGFISDGATIPIALRCIFPPLSKWLGAAFIHDQFCDKANATGKYSIREAGDNMFYDLVRECGTSRWRSRAMASAVKGYGKYLKARGKLK